MAIQWKRHGRGIMFSCAVDAASGLLRRCLAMTAILSLVACSLFQADHFGSRPMTFEQLPGWLDDNHAQALEVFTSSCDLMAQKTPSRSSGSGIKVPKDVWQSLCSDAQSVPPGNSVAARLFFERRFVPYRITNNGHDKGLCTGYYEPVLYGSLKKHGDFKYPLYMRPADLKNGHSYYTHAEIDQGALKGRHLELVWVDDPVMIFFLQIQGSGLIRLDKGGSMLVGYDGQNNQTYVSLGKVMGDENLLPKDDINFFTLRQWLYDYPDRAFEMMERNPSYVFFKKLDQSGPVGAVGNVLTPQRSLAVDNHYIPYGLPLFMETELPSLNGGASEPFHRILIAQDTGGAIRGPVRGDVFFGQGSQAEYLAGYMKGHGVYNLLVPKEIVGQLQ